MRLILTHLLQRFGIQRAIFTTHNELPLRPLVSLRALERPLNVPLLVSRGLLRIDHGKITITDLVNRYTPPEFGLHVTVRDVSCISFRKTLRWT
jgi:hypothetical protein